MNIITNKEVFSEENQAKLPKKIDKRSNRVSRTQKDQTQTKDQLRKAVVPQAKSQLPATSTMSDHAKAPAQTPSEQPNPTGEVKKTVFYQASRPRQNRTMNHFRPASSPSGQVIDPRTLVPRVAKPASPPFSPRPTQSEARPENQPGRPLSNSRFTTAARRPGRGQFPQDKAGTFLQPVRPSQPGQQKITPQPMRIHSNQKVKIIPLGGLEEIGKNMTVLEYGDDIIIVDMGFMFPDSDMFGVDYVIPDVSYLQDKKDRIRGAIITHGHLDHTGAIPYIIEKLGFPTLYGTLVTMGMAKQRLEEFGLYERSKLVVIEPEKDVLQLGAFRVNAFRLTHSVPGAIGLEIETPNGRVVYCTDWKFDYTPADNQPVDFRTLAAIGLKGVDLLLSDSTNADRPGHSISEKVVETTLCSSIEEAKGRIIIAMFSSNLSRIQQAINAAHKNGRKVLVVGRSMQQNVEMAVSLKAITLPPNTLIGEREANRFADNQLLILSTGAQGEDRSALTRMASGEHRVIKIKKGDTVIISASPIPGNERSVNNVMDILYKAGAQVIYNKILDVHTTGHANQEDLKLMLALMKPKYFVPLHGERSKLILHGKLAQEVGVAPENVIIGDNGLILEIDSDGKVSPTENHVPAGYVMVDGLGIGDVGNIVLRDRQAMAQEGIFLVFSVYDAKHRRFLNSPDIISRGFIYMRENEQFVNDIRNEIRNFLQRATQGTKAVDLGQVRNELRDFISKMLYEKTERQPMVIPVITEV